VYCIVLLVCDHNVDRNAHSLKVLNKRRHGQCIGTCMFSSLGTNAFRMGNCNLSFAMKSCACASTCIPGRDLLLLSQYKQSKLCRKSFHLYLFCVMCDYCLLPILMLTRLYRVNILCHSLCLSFMNKLAWRARFNPRPVCMGHWDIFFKYFSFSLSELFDHCPICLHLSPTLLIFANDITVKCHNSISWCNCM